MALQYRIHPGIGIARLGNSRDAFFLGPETPNGRSVELADDGSEVPIRSYKDSQHHIKRQGVRFRIFEYAIDDAGHETLVREITANEATITWHVRLANTKAAGRRILEDGTQLRNPTRPTASLVITPKFDPISGRGLRVPERITGRFDDIPVSLGELRTDAAGRLIVLGGFGNSGSKPVTPITNFANNPNWYDDVSDGPVDAELTFANGRSVAVQGGAWVVVAPPDFAPGILGIATLYDIALDAAVKRGWLAVPTRPSFRNEVLPILERATKLRFVNEFPYWNSFSRDFALLGKSDDAAAAQTRIETFQLMLDIQDSGTLNNFRYTDLQRRILEQWVQGVFAADYDSPPEVVLGPAALDRASLEQGVGGGFFPGIEIGILSQNPYLYSELCRFTREPFIDGSETMLLEPGSITQRMALPWQADFLKCRSNWWPAQRPDMVFLHEADESPSAQWIDGINSHADLVENFWKLGIVTEAARADGSVVYVEVERHPSMTPRAD